MVTLTDRPDITMDVFSNKLSVGKGLVSFDAL